MATDATATAPALHPAVAAAVAAAVPSLTMPAAGARLLRECAFTFDSPESEEGLYISLHNHLAFSKAHVAWERRRHPGAASTLFLKQVWKRVARPAPPAPAPGVGDEVTKMAIGVEGGFHVDQPAFDIVKTAYLVVVLPPGSAAGVPGAVPLSSTDADATTAVEYAHPDDTAAFPAAVRSVVDTLLSALETEAASEKMVWEDRPEVSRYALELTQLDNGVAISPDPASWMCAACGQKENLWLNLGDGYIGCGRAQVGGAPGKGHALAHYQELGMFPLVVKLGTITPAGGDVYSYAPDENDAVEDPFLAQHLAHWGINIMTATKTEKSTAEMAIKFQMEYEFGRITESGKTLVPVTGPGFIGCDNLGNTCYMNSVVQVYASMPEVKALYAPDEGRAKIIVDTAPSPPTNDLLTQTAKLVRYLHSDRYALAPDATPAVAEGTGEGAALAAMVETKLEEGAAGGAASKAAKMPLGAGARCGFVTPRMFKLIIGKNHPDFCTNAQQDVPHFVAWLYEQLEKAHHSRGASDRVPPLPDGTHTLPALTTFVQQSRLVDMQSHGVRYRTTKEWCLRLNIPLDAATNTAHVAAAKAAVAAAVAKAVAEAGTGGAADADAIAHDVMAPKPAKRAKVDVEDAAATAARKVADRVHAELAPTIPKLIVPFEACVSKWKGESVVDDFVSPVTGAPGMAASLSRIITAPRYLVVVMNRYTVAADWTVFKVDASVPMPQSLSLGADGVGLMVAGSPGLQVGELDLDSLAPAPAPAAPPTAGPTPDTALVAELVGMGFPQGACQRAAVAVSNAGVSEAMEWVLAHMEDANFGDPYVPAPPPPAPAASGADVDAEALTTLVDVMGFDTKRATYALKQCGGVLDRAADWLFSHANDPLPEEEAPTPGGGGVGGGSTPASPAWLQADTVATPQYHLAAIVSHLGSNTASGHYVCHIRKSARTGLMAAATDPDAKWYLFNDSNVAESQDPPFDLGYMYVYRRA